MKVFISSVMGGFEQYRAAARAGVRAVGSNPVMAEDFGARDESSRRACLREVREADVVVLVLGERYGPVLDEGTSATEQEYAEAREHTPILAFVHEGVESEGRQLTFRSEVEDWVGGRFRQGFTTPEELQEAISQAVHRFELDSARGGVDADELTERARAALPDTREQRSRLQVVVSGGPVQALLRPSELRDNRLARDLQREALLGDHAVLDPSEGTECTISNNTLALRQPSAAVTVDTSGTVATSLARLSDGRHSLPSLIIEDVTARVETALRFAGVVLDRIDHDHRLNTVVPGAQLTGAEWMGWRTREEAHRSPNSMTGGLTGRSAGPRFLEPATIARPDLTRRANELAEDLVVLLREENL